jgi:hypothetical protein
MQSASQRVSGSPVVWSWAALSDAQQHGAFVLGHVHRPGVLHDGGRHNAPMLCKHTANTVLTLQRIASATDTLTLS